jgi:NAD(P)-dependent dehydrogenase (short-subunit alcohol dehydrogenase family)
MSRPLQLRDRVCLITGGAQGIGAATAQALTKRGARVVLADLQEHRARTLAESLTEDAIAVRTDVREPASVQAAVAAAVERFGRLDILVNNAGIGVPRTIDQLDEDSWQRTLDVNLSGPFRLVKAALPELRRRRGHIVTVASMAARVWTPLLAHYSATKAGIAAFSETMRVELRRDGIRITTVYFGTIDTPLLATGLDDASVTDRMRFNVERARRLGLSPLVTADQAGEAIARGIERERRAVIVPARAKLPFYVGAPFQRLIERTAW